MKKSKFFKRAILLIIVLILGFIAVIKIIIWDSTRLYDDLIELNIRYVEIPCAEEDVYFQVLSINSDKFDFLIDKNIVLVNRDNSIYRSEFFKDKAYLHKNYKVTGKLYKATVNSGYYNCDANAYKFQSMFLKDDLGKLLWHE